MRETEFKLFGNDSSERVKVFFDDTDDYKRARFNVLGFFIRNPPRHFGNPISFFNACITHTQYTWARYKLKDIQVVAFENTTAFKIRLGTPQYRSGWTFMLRCIFSDAIGMIGEDILPDICDVTSNGVREMFRKMGKHPESKASIYKIQSQIQQQ
jgi:hypothetical protein